MAYCCVLNRISECDGCGECGETERLIMRDFFGEPIYAGDDYYEIGDDIISADNIRKWLRYYKKVAGEK